MPTPFNGLTNAQAERLAMLAEECAEVIQMVNKILRHGYDSPHPKDQSETTNQVLLSREIGDLELILYLMLIAGDFDVGYAKIKQLSKVSALYKYTHHQPDVLLSDLSASVKRK